MGDGERWGCLAGEEGGVGEEERGRLVMDMDDILWGKSRMKLGGTRALFDKEAVSRWWRRGEGSRGGGTRVLVWAVKPLLKACL